MDAPQSRDEIDPIETAIRTEIDDLLRIRWNPRSFVTRPGAFDAYGLAIGPQYEGRWEVVKPVDGQEAVIYQLRWDGDGNESYRAVGWWLLDFLRKWDRANQHWMDEMKRMYADEDRAERAIATEQHEAEREHWDRKSFEIAGEQWIGRGFGTRASHAAAATLTAALTAAPLEETAR